MNFGTRNSPKSSHGSRHLRLSPVVFFSCQIIYLTNRASMARFVARFAIYASYALLIGPLWPNKWPLFQTD